MTYEEAVIPHNVDYFAFGCAKKTSGRCSIEIVFNAEDAIREALKMYGVEVKNGTEI